jgi:shikimate dehydrogenase
LITDPLKEPMLKTALFGKPLQRRHSAVMHNAAFKAASVNACYELHEVDESQLLDYARKARNGDWLGFQVTAPHKQFVMGLLDEVEPAAQGISAVNSVAVTSDAKLVGFNTDVIGFLAGLRAVVGRLDGISAVVAGSGGVGHAATYGLATNGVGRITVLDLNIDMPQRLAASMRDVADIEPMKFEDASVRHRLETADLFVNATSVGMLSPGPVIDVNMLAPHASVFDVVYIPAQTELVRQALGRGLRAANGDTMLIAQAAAAWMRWTGLPDPSDIMRAAVEPLLLETNQRP